MYATGYLGLLTRQVMCDGVSRCYNNLNFCLWTNGSQLTQSAAKTACQQRNSSFLPRITNNDIQSKLREFRTAAGNLLVGGGFWIDVHTANVDSFHWIDGSSG